MYELEGGMGDYKLNTSPYRDCAEAVIRMLRALEEAETASTGLGGVKADDLFSIESLLYNGPDISAAARASQRTKRVIIIGAGIAGLVAALRLLEHGHDVQVLERSDRCGGRIHTWRPKGGSGPHNELGAMRIPADHKLVFKYIDELGLTQSLRPFYNVNDNCYLYLRGKRERLGKNWAYFVDNGAFENAFLDVHNGNMPCGELFKQVILRHIVALVARDRDRLSIFDGELTGMAPAVDGLSLAEFLRRSTRPLSVGGVTRFTAAEAAIDGKSVLSGLGLSEEEVEFLGNATGLLQYERESLIEAFVDGTALNSDRYYRLESGMESLIDALRARIDQYANEKSGSPIKTNHSVEEVDVQGETVSVTAKNGCETIKLTADYVICTAPAPACQNISFTNLDPRKRHAWAGLNYASASKSLVLFKERFWEVNDRIFAGGSFSDLPIQMVYYPSDNATPSGVGGTAPPNISGIAQNGEFDPVPTQFTAKDKDVSYTPAVLTASYTWQQRARRLQGLSNDAHRDDVVLKSLALMHAHPTKGLKLENLVEEIKHHAWDAQSSPGGGAFAHFSPGERGRHQDALIAPHPVESPRVFFAGEHLAVLHAWIQGAIQTGEVATCNVLESP